MVMQVNFVFSGDNNSTNNNAYADTVTKTSNSTVNTFISDGQIVQSIRFLDYDGYHQPSTMPLNGGSRIDITFNNTLVKDYFYNLNDYLS